MKYRLRPLLALLAGTLLALSAQTARAEDSFTLSEMKLRLSSILGRIQIDQTRSASSRLQDEIKMIQELLIFHQVQGQARITDLFGVRRLWCNPPTHLLAYVTTNPQPQFLLADNLSPTTLEDFPVLPIGMQWIFSPDYRWIAWTATEGVVQSYAVLSRDSRKTTNLSADHTPFFSRRALAFSPDGTCLLTGDRNVATPPGIPAIPSLLIWNLGTSKIGAAMAINNGPATRQEWEECEAVGTRDNQGFLVRYRNRLLSIRLGTNHIVADVSFPVPVCAIALAPDGNLVAGYVNGEIRIVDPISLETRRTQQLPSRDLRHLLFLPENQGFVAVTSQDAWLLPNLRDRPAFLTWNPSEILAAALSPDGKTLIYSTADTLWSCPVQPVSAVAMPATLTFDHMKRARSDFLAALSAATRDEFMTQLTLALQSLQEITP